MNCNGKKCPNREIVEVRIIFLFSVSHEEVKSAVDVGKESELVLLVHSSRHWWPS